LGFTRDFDSGGFSGDDFPIDLHSIVTLIEVGLNSHTRIAPGLPRLKNARQESLICRSLQSVDHPQPVKPFKKGPIICEFSG